MSGQTEGRDSTALSWRGWKFAIAMYLVAIAGCVFISFLLGPLLGLHEWIFSEDLWYTTNSSQFAINGGAGAVYAANPYFAALPGFIYLYAPVVGLTEHFGMVPAYPIGFPHPSMLLVVGPFFFMCGATAVLGVDFLAETLDVPIRRRRAILAGVALLLVAPTSGFEGHPEDLLALALVCVALSLLVRRRFMGAGLVLAAAVIMQTWAGLLIPVFLAATPAGHRLKMLLRSSAAPAALGVLLLALDFKDAATDLLRQPMPNTGQHLPWWALGSHFTVSNLGVTYQMVSGSTTRSFAVVVAVLAAFWVYRRPSPECIVFASALAVYARCFFEVEFWPYYVAPAAVLFLLLGARTTRGNLNKFSALTAGASLLYLQSTPALFWTDVSPWLALVVLAATGMLCIRLSLPDTTTLEGRSNRAGRLFSIPPLASAKPLVLARQAQNPAIELQPG